MKEVIAPDYSRRLSFSPKPKLSGICHRDRREIIIFARRKKHRDPNELLNTIIHEEIHAVCPNYSEKVTKKVTSALIAIITPEQIAKYSSLYGLEFNEGQLVLPRGKVIQKATAEPVLENG